MPAVPSERPSTETSPTAVTMPVNLRVSAYERVASLLVALLVIVGFVVFDTMQYQPDLRAAVEAAAAAAPR